MKVGKYLLEKHNFGDEEVKSRFLDQFGYSERVLEGILDDRYPALLTCHLQDLSIFTGDDIDFLNSLQEFDKLTDFEKQTLNPAPMGKPFVTLPVKTEVRIKDPEIPLHPVIENDPELDALFARIKEYTKGKTFKLITPSAIKSGSPIPRDGSEVDYVVTTYPITGPESVKIVKGRELGIGNGDKFVFANQMRSTINKLGLSNPPPEEVDVLLSNSRIAALMEDPEFRKEWEGVVGEQLVELAKRQLKKGLLDTEGIDIYTQPTLRQGETKITTEESATKEVLVPVGLLRELANIAIDNGYPCAEEAFQLLTKNK